MNVPHDRRVSPDRRSDPPLTQDQLLKTVATGAAQQVAAIHRRRLVVQSFFAAMIASLAVILPIVFIVNGERVNDSRANAAYNCNNLSSIAKVFSDFVQSDADLRYKQQHYAQKAKVLAAFGRIIEPATLKKLSARSDKIDKDTRSFWRDDLQPQLDALAKVNCNAHIK